jgi:hypothetical protein
MTRLVGLLVIGAALIAIIAWEIGYAPTADVASPHPRVVVAGARQPAAEADHTTEWVATVLARPLFSPDRRPAAAETATIGGTGLPGLPRLTGILVGPFGRQAIFAVNGRKPIVVEEGARIDAYTVKSIDVAQVRLVGPEGVRVLNPSFLAASGMSNGAAAPSHPTGQTALQKR